MQSFRRTSACTPVRRSIATLVEAEPGWSGPSQADWQQTQQAIGQIGEFLQLLAPQEEQPSGLDPFAEDFQQQLKALVDEEIAPLHAAFTAIQEQEVAAALAPRGLIGTLSPRPQPRPFDVPRPALTAMEASAALCSRRYVFMRLNA